MAKNEELEAQTKKEAADAALKDAQAKKTDAETERSKAQKKYDEAIAQNGELTQGRCRSGEHGCRGSKKCGDRAGVSGRIRTERSRCSKTGFG